MLHLAPFTLDRVPRRVSPLHAVIRVALALRFKKYLYTRPSLWYISSSTERVVVLAVNMPGRLRQFAGQRTATTQEDGSYNIPGLDFHQPLTWRAGKALPVADLLSRLQKLGSELRGLDQGQVPAKEFKQLAQDLAHSNLLGHKDKGIRAWTLCSIVDILNICAPDAPFNPGQLRVSTLHQVRDVI